MKLNYHNRLDKVWSMTTTKQDNNMTNCIGVVYTKIETKLPWPVGQDAVYHEK